MQQIKFHAADPAVIRNIPAVLLLILSLILVLAPKTIFAVEQSDDLVRNCGPAVLKKVFDNYQIKSDFTDLIRTTNTQMGKTTMKDMTSALNKRGLHSAALTISYKELEKLLDTHTIIAHVNKNSHYIVVEKIIKDAAPSSNKDKVRIYNPSLDPCQREIFTHVFLYGWSGKVIVVSKKPEDLAKYGKPLTEQEMTETVGGDACRNSDKSAGAGNKDVKTKEPVQINNGNLTLDTMDMSVKSRGIPVEFERHYSAQVIMSIDGWKMDKGAGPWSIENGELSGYGDRILNKNELEYYTVEVDMKTVTPGSEDYHCAWLNIKYASEKDRYFFLIKRGGMIELGKYRSGARSSLFQKQTRYDPTKWNHIKATIGVGRIMVYVNDILEIDATDDGNIIERGFVALESCFSNSHFDNVGIRGVVAGTIFSVSYDFNIEDNNTMFGHGWTTLYDMKVTKLSDESVLLLRGNGVKERYFPRAGGNYEPPVGVYDTLARDPSGSGYLFKTKSGMKYRFNSEGSLVMITDPNGNQMNIKYAAVNQ